MEWMGDRSTNRPVYSVKYHMIWSSKDWTNVLAESVDARLKDVGGQLVGKVYGSPLAVVRQYVNNQNQAA